MSKVIELRGERVEIDIDLHYKGSPGKLYGRPDDCYPPEDPEFDLVSLMWKGVNLLEYPEFFDDLIEEARDIVMEEIRP